MGMSRKDCTLIAEALRDAYEIRKELRHGEVNPDAEQMWRSCVRHVARALAHENHNFRYPRFYLESGYKE